MVSLASRPYTPLAFANEFVRLSAPNGIQHMKLQKLTYYAYGWWLAYYPEPILSEAPQVWKHGPVFESMYHALKHNGNDPILYAESSTPVNAPPFIDDGDSEVRELVDWVWAKYGSYGSLYLSERTHEKGTPWQKSAAALQYRIPYGYQIPDETIRAYFKDMATNSRI